LGFKSISQEAIHHLHRFITINEIDALIKNLPTKKSPLSNRFTVEFYQTYKEELTLRLINLFYKIVKEVTVPIAF
jgi:hypothetical protein